jgi:hypothetical protein
LTLLVALLILVLMRRCFLSVLAFDSSLAIERMWVEWLLVARTLTLACEAGLPV